MERDLKGVMKRRLVPKSYSWGFPVCIQHDRMVSISLEHYRMRVHWVILETGETNRITFTQTFEFSSRELQIL